MRRPNKMFGKNPQLTSRLRLGFKREVLGRYPPALMERGSRLCIDEKELQSDLRTPRYLRSGKQNAGLGRVRPPISCFQPTHNLK